MIAKVCPCCGRGFERPAWDALAFVGVMHGEGEQGPEHLELRNCVCGSTLAREVTDAHELVTLTKEDAGSCWR
jgi:hypothetical protein